jgi:hypothetical protein
MENQGIAQEQAVENPSVQFLSDEEVQAAQAPQETQSVIEQLQEEVAPQQESTEPAETIENTETTQTPDEEEVDIEGSVLSTPQQQERALDERVEAIARFVEETGRDPQDWFRYQQLDASEMDDLTAVKLQMISDYQDLSSEELDILLGSKYKLDPDLHTEDEVKLSQLQLKMDAKAAREKITNLRDSYKTPMRTEAEVDSSSSPIDDKWISSMTTELNALEGVEFDLGDGNSFTFGLTNEYKSQLAEKNTRLDEFFDPYVREDGSWDYDKLNIHRSVIDNMEAIAKSIYKQGMADGQRNIVDRAANVSTNSPNPQPESSPLADQLRNALGLGRGFGSNS